MTREPSHNMRAWLKGATSDIHDRVDEAFSGFDLFAAGGQAAFLRAQSAGLTAARLCFQTRGEDMWERVAGQRVASTGYGEPASVDLRAHDPLGVAYVVAGSLHGTSVLRGQLVRGGVEPIPPFFDGTDWKPMWADVIARLDTAPRTRRPAILSAARATFDAFHRAACAQKVVA